MGRLRNVLTSRFAVRVGIVAFVVVAVLGYPILNMCRLTGSCTVRGFKWAWHMTHNDEYGLIGEHLVPGKEYYFEVRAAYFDKDYPQYPPVSAEQVEPQDEVIIRSVRSDQKIDWGVYYKRSRESYLRPFDLVKYGVVVNGDYFFSTDADGVANKQITLDEALRLPAYVKVTAYLQKVAKAEIVRRVEENRNRFTYWSTTGYRKEMVGYDITDGKRTDWRDCYAESDGDHATCFDPPKKSGG